MASQTHTACANASAPSIWTLRDALTNLTPRDGVSLATVLAM
jgi:hypothetical protein